jgi:hypothetical protein
MPAIELRAGIQAQGQPAAGLRATFARAGTMTEPAPIK